MSDAASDIADLIFVAVCIVAILVVVIYFHIKGDKHYRDAERLITERGYTVTHAYQRNRGDVTWVWGRFATPQPFYLHISNRDPIGSFAGQLGIADIKVGHTRFDKDFTVRTNQPEWAKELLTQERCERLSKVESLQFIVTSVGNLLTPDWWPAEPNRDLRVLWMLRTDGKLDEAAAEAYLALARELKAAVQQYSVRHPFTEQDCLATTFEGR